MHLDHFWNLMAKKLAGEASKEEEGELTSLIKANPHLSYPAQNVADLWKLKPPENRDTAEKAFEKLKTAITKEAGENDAESNGTNATDHAIGTTVRNGRLTIFIAAAITISMVSFLIWNNRRETTNTLTANQVQEIYTRPGTRTKVMLPDSSIVWLNAGSKLSYKQPFGVTQRIVALTGEAYFDVVKNKKPFIVHTKGAQIKVLGTAFNVRSYPSEKEIETSLIHGKVEIMLDKNPGSKYVLKPNEKLTVQTGQTAQPDAKKTQQPLVVLSTLHQLNKQTIVETSWIDNKLVFIDESFEEVALRMERWYGVSIHFKEEKLKAEYLTGVFEKETIWQALEAIKLTTPFHYYSLKNNEIILTH
jgi:transmembrane sensor